MVTLCPKTKQWWTCELTTLHQHANKLGRQASKLDHHPTHPIHTEHKEAKKCYHNTLESTKRQHWHNWLKRAEDPDLWMAHKYLSAPASNGGKAQIPALKLTKDSKDILAATNEDKGRMLAKAFFSQKPDTDATQEENNYPPPVYTMDPLTKAHVTVLWLGPQRSGRPTRTLSTSSSCSSSSNSNTSSSSASQSTFQAVAPDTPDRRTARILAAHQAT
jgi:hypothetical protein